MGIKKDARTPTLANQIETVTRAKRKVANASFKAVVSECSNKILRTVKYNKDEFIIFEVPIFIVGHPMFNRDDCVQHLIRYLKRMKMQAVLIPPYTVCIAWNSGIDVAGIVKNVSGTSSTLGPKPNEKIHGPEKPVLNTPIKKDKPKKHDPLKSHPPTRLIAAMAKRR